MLYLLIIVPMISLLFIWARFSRKKRLKKFGLPHVLNHLMPDASLYMPTVKIVIELCALTLIIIALGRPYVESGSLTGESEETTAGIEVMICFDVSNSMLASSTDDPSGVSRLQRAKFILEKIVDKMTDDKVGLIVYAGDAYTQLPITSDYISAKMFINSINTKMVPTQGTAIGAALDMAINSFTPESDFQKAIVLITDAENFEDNAVEEAKRAADAGIEVDVIGIGSSKGMPIPINASRTEFLTMAGGQEVRTALNETLGQDIAEAGNGIYISGSGSSAVSELSEQLDQLAKTEYKRSTTPSAASELFPVAIAVALLLLLIDIFLPYSKISWLRNINFFSKH